MWVTGFPGKETERENISLCCRYYPQFLIDVNALLDNGIIKRISFDHYEWTKDKTSLAQYFVKLDRPNRIPGGRWDPVENTFWIKGKPIKRGSLTKLAGENGNKFKPDKSRGYKEVMEIVLRYREEVRRQEEEAGQLRAEQAKLRGDFQAIEELINNFRERDIEKLREIKKKIKNILT